MTEDSFEGTTSSINSLRCPIERTVIETELIYIATSWCERKVEGVLDWKVCEIWEVCVVLNNEFEIVWDELELGGEDIFVGEFIGDGSDCTDSIGVLVNPIGFANDANQPPIKECKQERKKERVKYVRFI